MRVRNDILDYFAELSRSDHVWDTAKCFSKKYYLRNLKGWILLMPLQNVLLSLFKHKRSFFFLNSLYNESVVLDPIDFQCE